MRTVRFLATIAALGSIALFAPAADATTPISLVAHATADTIPYGQPQTFSLGGSTAGQKCTFTYVVGLNGVPVPSGGSPSAVPITVTAALPWTSPDLKLPSSKGLKYTVTISAGNAPNACTGVSQVAFEVVPQIGQITSITASEKVIATAQSETFGIYGKTYGYCRYVGNITKDGAPFFNSGVVSDPLPLSATLAFAQPGTYVASEDEIDDGGVPEGCTGHVKVQFTVAARPTCPSASGAKYYDAPDDSEYGCFMANTTYTATPPAYQCPSNYAAFGDTANSAGWGCRETGKQPLPPGIVAGMIDGSPVPTPTPALALPTLASINYLSPTNTHVYRPFANAFYVGEDVKVNVTGNVPNTGGFDPQKCDYAVDLEDTTLINGATLPFNLKPNNTEFTTIDLGPAAMNGVMQIHAFGVKNPGGPPACLGDLKEKPLDVFPNTSFITGFKIVGFAYHFNAHDDMAMGQFCSNCTSIFSPAHNREFLGFEPVIRNMSAGGSCAYKMTLTGTQPENVPFDPLAKGWSYTVQFKNGDPPVPGNRGLAFPTPLSGPWWTEYNNDSNTVNVTVTPGSLPNVPACNVLGGKLSKTITFTVNLNLPAVTATAGNINP